jgi:pilus assembly protein CpaF
MIPMEIKTLVEVIQNSLDISSGEDYKLGPSAKQAYSEKLKVRVQELLEPYPPRLQERVQSEFFGWGPLESLVQDPEICEVLVNGPESIWFEKNGRLEKHPDQFLSSITYRNIFDQISHSAKVHPTAEHPIVDGHTAPFRLNMVRSEIHPRFDILSLRRHPDNPWSLSKLLTAGWCTPFDLSAIRQWIHQGKNFLVIGPTSSGKTSVLNACMAEFQANERAVILEDSSEIRLPNEASIKLLTRKDTQGLLPEVSLMDLLRTSLRLRPDRIIIGEMRGPEAKDFLMALSCGHRGSLGTLHAEEPSQALLRLEMLVQLGAPQWNIVAIRRLIHMSLDGILVTGRNSQGQRIFKGLYTISSLEDSGFTIERLGSDNLSSISSDNGDSPSLAIF